MVHGDHVLEGKAPYLNVWFFVGRGLFFVMIWWAYSRFFLKGSLAQDAGGLSDDERAGITLRMRKWSAPFMLIFALTVTFAAFDWIMSLEPHWFSTIFGVYVFSGMTLTGLAV